MVECMKRITEEEGKRELFKYISKILIYTMIAFTILGIGIFMGFGSGMNFILASRYHIECAEGEPRL